MLRWLLTLVYFLTGVTLGVWCYHSTNLRLPDAINNVFLYGAIGGIVFLAATLWTLPYFVKGLKKVERKLLSNNVTEIFFATIGMLVGLLFTVFITLLSNMLDIPIVREILPLISAVILGYLGYQLGLKKTNEVLELFNRAPKNLTKKLLDTSVIIDGRVLEVLKSGFLEGEIIVPQFVLDELQLIADSTDHIKRDKGQHGLDILNELQKYSEHVKIKSIQYDKLDVDQQLIELAKDEKAAILTTDYNLNRVAKVHKITVLNVNELSEEMQLQIQQGDTFEILITKAGKEDNQGVGYLTDGTMVVLDAGVSYINETVTVEVTSILQTHSGRIIFTKLGEKS